MPRFTASRKEKEMKNNENQWNEAIRDAEERVLKLERERERLRMAIRLMKRQVKDGAPWPTAEP